MSYPSKILDSVAVMDSLNEYASPRARLSYMVKTGDLIKLRRGLYLPREYSDVSRITIANRLYGPSYVSFEYALGEYGMIPERVEIVTSASFGKNKNKMINTPIGTFTYQRINPDAYPYGIIWRIENDMPALIASREKALCDLLSTKRGVRSLSRFSALLFKDLRLDDEQIADLNQQEIAFLAERYPQQNVRLLRDWLKREFGHA